MLTTQIDSDHFPLPITRQVTSGEKLSDWWQCQM